LNKNKRDCEKISFHQLEADRKNPWHEKVPSLKAFNSSRSNNSGEIGRLVSNAIRNGLFTRYYGVYGGPLPPKMPEPAKLQHSALFDLIKENMEEDITYKAYLCDPDLMTLIRSVFEDKRCIDVLSWAFTSMIRWQFLGTGMAIKVNNAKMGAGQGRQSFDDSHHSTDMAHDLEDGEGNEAKTGENMAHDLEDSKGNEAKTGENIADDLEDSEGNKAKTGENMEYDLEDSDGNVAKTGVGKRG
jgi:hypothetical protein